MQRYYQRMLPLQALRPEDAQSVQIVLMDIDDTLTTNGKLTQESYAGLWQLHDAGLKVVPITGRPAGWCDLIAREWPVDGVVGENGAFAFWEAPGRRLQTLVHPNAVRNDAPALQRVLGRALAEVPGSRPARDQFARLYDIAIDFAEEEPVLPFESALAIKRICDEEGVRAKISSIHVNAWLGDYDKLSMTTRFLAARSGYDDKTDKTRVIFVGDSPNDEPMFAHFPLTCGVANLLRYEGHLVSKPTFVTLAAQGAGFAEFVQVLIDKRKT
ncbi:MAG TPA: HAD-IIB family hydrolase [Spirochaetales bacterium]|nr:HAD-IIB family hydrolase [Spirochaetales bacterium]